MEASIELAPTTPFASAALVDASASCSPASDAHSFALHDEGSELPLHAVISAAPPSPMQNAAMHVETEGNPNLEAPRAPPNR